jgi:hypothetical protein
VNRLLEPVYDLAKRRTAARNPTEGWIHPPLQKGESEARGQRGIWVLLKHIAAFKSPLPPFSKGGMPFRKIVNRFLAAQRRHR